MPWQSDKQRKWAHATHQPWAPEWDAATKRKKKVSKSQMSFPGMPEPEKYGQEDIPRYAMHRGERMKVDHMLPGSKDHFVLHDKHDVKHVAHRKVLMFIKDAKIIKNVFGVADTRERQKTIAIRAGSRRRIKEINAGSRNVSAVAEWRKGVSLLHKRKPSESRVKAIAEQDQQIAQMTQQAAAHHAQNRMPMSLTQQQRATIKSRKKVYGYHIKHGWGIHDKTDAVYPAREFYNTAAKPGQDPRRQNQKPTRAKRIVDNTSAETS